MTPHKTCTSLPLTLPNQLWGCTEINKSDATQPVHLHRRRHSRRRWRCLLKPKQERFELKFQIGKVFLCCCQTTPMVLHSYMLVKRFRLCVCVSTLSAIYCLCQCAHFWAVRWETHKSVNRVGQSTWTYKRFTPKRFVRKCATTTWCMSGLGTPRWIGKTTDHRRAPQMHNDAHSLSSSYIFFK